MWRSDRGRAETGASAVEFAVVLPILLLLVLGIIEFGLAFNRSQAFEAAAREGGRLASIGYDVSDLGDGDANLAVRQTAASTVSVNDVSVAFEGAQCGEGEPPAGGPELVTVIVRLTESSVDRYGIRIPSPGYLVTADPSYESRATFVCETGP